MRSEKKGSVLQESGLVCRRETGQGRGRLLPSALRGLRALALYISLWGCLCSMASLGALGAAALLPGGLIAAVAPLLGAERRKKFLLPAVLILAAAVLAFTWRTALDGCGVLLNRLFAASEGAQAYLYEKLPVVSGSGEWGKCMSCALLILGLLSGLLWGFALDLPAAWPAPVGFLAFAGGVAYLGISPWGAWPALYFAALVWALWPDSEVYTRTGGLLALGVVGLLCALCALVCLAFPGEDAALSAWEEGARDRLALETAAYAGTETEKREEEKELTEDREFTQEEGTAGNPEGEEEPWAVPVPALLVILLFALLLFLPAVWSDALKKRRERNRGPMGAEAAAASVRAMFLYTLRWLRLGGLRRENVPMSGYAGQVEALLSPAHREAYERAVPLWQEAAYSSHPMSEAQRREMRTFMESTARAVWEKLSWRKRLLAKYGYGL